MGQHVSYLIDVISVYTSSLLYEVFLFETGGTLPTLCTMQHFSSFGLSGYCMFYVWIF